MKKWTLSVIAALLAGSCSMGMEQLHDEEIGSLRSLVVEHPGAIERASTAVEAQASTTRYAGAALAAMDRMQGASCPMMTPAEMTQAIGPLSTAIRDHEQRMRSLADMAAMRAAARGHASGMRGSLDDLAMGHMRSCNCGH